jgi:hypothetical protein
VRTGATIMHLFRVKENDVAYTTFMERSGAEKILTTFASDTNAVFFMRMFVIAKLLHMGREGAQTICMLAGKILKLLLHDTVIHSR